MQPQEKKDVVFVDGSNKDLKAFPRGARFEAGFNLDLLQRGETPNDWKPMRSVGPGVKEIRIACEEGAFRVFYVVNRPDAIYVLHAFKKTTQKTEKRDIDLAKARLRSLG